MIFPQVPLPQSPMGWQATSPMTSMVPLAHGPLADIAKHQTRYKERETVRTLNLYGDCLMVLGRKAQAIAKWQNVLDRFPTCSDFGRIEKKVKAVLGIR